MVPSFQVVEESRILLLPTVYTGLRHYYNFERRVKKGKATINNSAGYVGAEATLYIGSERDFLNGYQLSLAPQWGFQTRLGRKFTFDLSLAPGIATDGEDTTFYFGGRIGASFIL